MPREKLSEEKISNIEKKKRVVVEDAKPKKVDDGVIYLWLDEFVGNYYACARAFGQLWGYGFKIDKQEDKKDTEKRRYWRARREVVNHVENTLNVLWMYGKKALDSHGNISWDNVKYQERLHSWFGVLRKPRKFPIVEINREEAHKMKLI